MCQFSVVACGACGAVFADSSASQAAYNTYYSEHSQIYHSPSASLRHQHRAAMLSSWDDTRDRSQKVVDVGSADGAFLRALQKQGYTRLFGVNPTTPPPPPPEHVVHEMAFAQGTFDRLSEVQAIQAADLVVSFHVFEHILDTHRAMEQIRKTIRPGGLLFVEVPSLGGKALLEEARASPMQHFNIEHINYFSQESLANLLRQHRFEVIKSGLFPMEMDERMRLCEFCLHGAYVLGRKSSSMPQRLPLARVDSTGITHYVAESTRRLIEVRACTNAHAHARACAHAHRNARTLACSLAQIDERLKREAALRTSPIFVYGTGQLLYKLLNLASLRQANIAAFIDDNPRLVGQVLHSAEVKTAMHMRQEPTFPILITTTTGCKVELIKKRIRGLNLSNPLLFIADEQL